MTRKQRQKLEELARERDIEVHAGMSNGDIYSLLGPTPPTDDQLVYLTDLVGGEVPVKTFAQARKLLDEFEDLRNSEILERFDWNVGDVLKWGDTYWRIANLYTGNHGNHKIRIEPIDLVDNTLGGALCKRLPGMGRTHNPRTLHLEGAHKVNRSVWPVKLTEYPPENQ